MRIYYKILREGAIAPHQAYADDAGSDLRACIGAPITLKPGETKAIPTGIAFEMMPTKAFNFPNTSIEKLPVAKVCSRSGMALKNSVFVLNAPGIIDQGFRGEVQVILHNAGNLAFTVKNGDKIAQLLIEDVYVPMWERVDELSETSRGEGGFGSSGSR